MKRGSTGAASTLKPNSRHETVAISPNSISVYLDSPLLDSKPPTIQPQKHEISSLAF
jgi:hypothetical protein